MNIKTRKVALAVLAAGVACGFSQTGAAEPAQGKAPAIVKKGTLGPDLCESTPFVFKDKVYRLEWFRNGSILRIMDRDSGQEISRFGAKHRFPCAVVDGDTVFVVGTKETHEWTGDTMTLFTSKDLTNWAEREKVAKAQDVNNSDIDFCEYKGRLVINYSWGNQQGVEFLAEAEFDGTLEQFLTGWFPQTDAPKQ